MCGCLSCTPYQGPGLQPRHVPWLGIQPVTLCFTGQCSTHWATPARVYSCLLSDWEGGGVFSQEEDWIRNVCDTILVTPVVVTSKIHSWVFTELSPTIKLEVLTEAHYGLQVTLGLEICFAGPQNGSIPATFNGWKVFKCLKTFQD